MLRFTLGLCLVVASLKVSAQDSLDWLINTTALDHKDAVGIHPRGLILPSELPAIRKRVESGQLSSYLEKVAGRIASLEQTIDAQDAFDAKTVAELAENYAILFLLTGEQVRAEQAYLILETVFEDDLIFNNPVSRGLTRAAMLRSMAITYDFCYEGWQQKQRNLVNRQLYKTIYATQANMGFDANYSLVSNWMGVRWGASLFAGLIWDHPDPSTKSIANPLIWDATKRLSDHLSENIYAQGWNSESIGYHLYNWSFVGQALIAFQNRHGARSALETLAPHTLKSMKAMSPAMIHIRTDDRVVGLKPDLSDDNLNVSDGLFGMNLRLYPEEQLGAIKWMHDYLEENSLYSALYDTENLSKINPQQLGWLNHADTTQGVVIFRNRFEDDQDVVALLNLSSKRIAGHRGPDVNTFRIIAGGVPVVIGGGRTGQVAGQSNLFTSTPTLKQKGDNSSGKLIHFEFDGTGSGYAIGKGSSVGVANHLRKFTVSFDKGTGAEAVFLVEDYSENGKLWRLNTPEFNEVEITEYGFVIRMPTGFTLRGTILHPTLPLKISKQRIRYGGDTERLNPGILWREKSYGYSTAIDIVLDGDIKVLMTLHAPDKPSSQINHSYNRARLQVGGIEFALFKPTENEY